MLVRVGNTPLRYGWGSRGQITEVLGAATLDDPNSCLIDPEARDAHPPVQAELWLGAHPSAPSRILDPERSGGARDLAEWIDVDPAAALGAVAEGLRTGDGAQLPFLLKILAAGEPLSLQVHPTLARARSGFAAEEAAGIPRTDPTRNYKDRGHKPELLLALSSMAALAGLRALPEIHGIIRAIDPGQTTEFARRALAVSDSGDLHDLIAWILAGGTETQTALAELDRWCAEGDGYGVERRNLARIRALHPGDAGALTAVLMNHIELAPGEAIAVRAGVLHAYLQGVGIEIMAASDNVLRGGLTPKHVDVPELLSVLDTAPGQDLRVAPVSIGAGAIEYPTAQPDFRLRRVEHGGRVEVTGPAIVLALRGEGELRAGGEALLLARGEAVYVVGHTAIEIDGDVDAVVAATGIDDTTSLPIDG